MKIGELMCLEGKAPDCFPDTSKALEYPNGLLAWGGDLSAERLMEAYRRGIFPWYSPGEPVLWWSPNPRCVLYPEKVYVSTRTRRRLRQGKFRLSADRAFMEVVEGCAESMPDRPTTWITGDMLKAYGALHESGIAHSIEVWNKDDELVGGLYGLSMGKAFFGESMFSRETDASKIALITLCRNLRQWGFGMIDCQVKNAHLIRMGCEELERSVFERKLKYLIESPEAPRSWNQSFRADWTW